VEIVRSLRRLGVEVVFQMPAAVADDVEREAARTREDFMGEVLSMDTWVTQDDDMPW
jgi:hypothetical protein